MTTSAPPSAAAPLAPSELAELPVHLTRFVGRAQELTELAHLLAATRLLTLTGAGGSGKTRLAIELATQATGTSRIAWVDLAPLADAELVPQLVATAFHVPGRADISMVDATIAAIGDARTLLVLDNCEHLVDACAALAERFLRACPRLTILATSREALGIASETAWLVPPLLGAEAVQLFVERARAAAPVFALSDANADAVREICRRLDGIPLAIELAAARIRVLSPEQIAERLNDAFRLLTAGSRTALPRHRTLRGTMDWSYDLLSEREQALLRRLATFSGSFSLEAAEDVCIGDPLDPEDILDGMATLVDKSLVVMEAGEGAARYRLLETVRQYGAERLAEAGELDRFRDRHGRFFLAFAEAVGPRLVGGPHEPGLMARVSLEHDNLRAASAWASADPARGEEALRFADSLFWYWYGTGYWFGTGQFNEARQYIAAALERAPHASGLLRGRALSANGLNALAQGDYQDAKRSFEQSLALMRQHGDRGAEAFVLSKLGATHFMLDEMDIAGELLDASHELAQTIEPPQMLHAFVGFWRGWAALARGDIDGAHAILSSHLQLGRLLAHRTIFGHGSAMLGRVELARGDRGAAFSHLFDGLRTHLEIGDGWGLQLDLEGLAAVAIARGRHAEGVRLMGAVDALRQRVAVALPGADRKERERLVARARATVGGEFERLYDEGHLLSMDDVVRLVSESAGAETAEHRVPVLDPAPLVTGEVAAAARPAGTPALRVLALGPLQVFIGDDAVDSTVWGSARPRELLVYLLMHPEGRTKEQVGLAFWPEASAAQLRNSFHVTLHRLRKALRNPDWISLVNDRYCVDPAVLREFDVAEFERAIAAARRGLKRRAEGAAVALEHALARFRGDFLDGEPAGDWHIEHRDRLQRLYADALVELGARLTEEERHAKAADVYRRVLARDDLHEDAVRALMLCHARLGERPQALRLYQRFSERLMKELDAEPDEKTVELAEQIQQGRI
jgi:predicted ATPase/DNA-binding SARP family transcriptional activator